MAGIAWVAETASKAEKQAVAIHVTLPAGARELRMDIQHRAPLGATAGDKLIEHLEWSYPAQPPTTQDAALELLPGDYAVTIHLLGAGRDPGPIDLDVAPGEEARLKIDLRTP